MYDIPAETPPTPVPHDMSCAHCGHGLHVHLECAVVGGAVVLRDGQVVGELQRTLTTISSVRIRGARRRGSVHLLVRPPDCMASGDPMSKGTRRSGTQSLRAGCGSLSGC